MPSMAKHPPEQHETSKGLCFEGVSSSLSSSARASSWKPFLELLEPCSRRGFFFLADPCASPPFETSMSNGSSSSSDSGPEPGESHGLDGRDGVGLPGSAIRSVGSRQGHRRPSRPSSTSGACTHPCTCLHSTIRRRASHAVQRLDPDCPPELSYIYPSTPPPERPRHKTSRPCAAAQTNTTAHTTAAQGQRGSSLAS